MKQSPDLLKVFLRDFWNQTQPHPSVESLSMFRIKGVPVVFFEVGTCDGAVWLESIHSTQERYS